MLVKFLAVSYVGTPIPLATLHLLSRCDPRGFWAVPFLVSSQPSLCPQHYTVLMVPSQRPWGWVGGEGPLSSSLSQPAGKYYTWCAFAKQGPWQALE